VSNSKPPERLTSLLWRAARASTRLYQSRLGELGLTTRQAAALLSLVEKPGVALGSLADELRSDQPTASAVVDRLIAADLVRRETDPVDRRRARLYPTDKALQIAENLADARRRTEALLEDILGEANARKLARVLLRLSEQMELEALAANPAQAGLAGSGGDPGLRGRGRRHGLRMAPGWRAGE
jgi:DNA-binding MarR family transcriptional regulator